MIAKLKSIYKSHQLFRADQKLWEAAEHLYKAGFKNPTTIQVEIDAAKDHIYNAIALVTKNKFML